MVSSLLGHTSYCSFSFFKLFQIHDFLTQITGHFPNLKKLKQEIMFNKIIFICLFIRSVWGLVNISISNPSIHFKCLLLLLINFSIYVDIRYIEHIFFFHLIVFDNWMYVYLLLSSFLHFQSRFSSYFLESKYQLS